MTDTTRDLIQRLAEELDTWLMAHHYGGVPPEIQYATTLVIEARAYLAQPEPEGVEDRIAKLEADLERERPATRLLSYKVGKAEPIENWGKGHTLVDPPATTAKPNQLENN